MGEHNPVITIYHAVAVCILEFIVAGFFCRFTISYCISITLVYAYHFISIQLLHRVTYQHREPVSPGTYFLLGNGITQWIFSEINQPGLITGKVECGVPIQTITGKYSPVQQKFKTSVTGFAHILQYTSEACIRRQSYIKQQISGFFAV